LAIGGLKVRESISIGKHGASDLSVIIFKSEIPMA